MNRVHNPIIQSQMVAVMLEQALKKIRLLKEEVWEPHLPEGWTGEERFKLLKGVNSGKIIDVDDLKASLSAEETMRETIEAQLASDISEIERSTEIDYTTNMPNSDVIPLNWIMPWTGARPTTQQMSIIEAHEKGHRVRGYSAAVDHFKGAFDISKATFTEEDRAMQKNSEEGFKDKMQLGDRAATLQEDGENYFKGYLFTDVEVAERMSQLKNYFGFNGTEVFTAEHLAYAEQHYVRDTNMDNGMRQFFEAITLETKGEFLNLINNSGI